MRENRKKWSYGLALLLWVSQLMPLAAQQGGRGVGVGAQPVSGQRVALVIGNGAYEAKIGPLDNPRNDAADMAAALQRLGFTLIGGKAHLNLNKRQMIEVVEQFGNQLTDGVGVFYYAGHGVQVDKRNYLRDVQNSRVGIAGFIG